MDKKLTITHLMLLLMLVVTSCTAPKLGYFQDLEPDQVFNLRQVERIKIQPGDKLAILVTSKDPQLAYLFNLPVVGHYRSSSSEASMSMSQMTNYTVNSDGTIYFPILGNIAIQGMTRAEVVERIRNELISRELLKDAVVTVNFLDLYYEVMGEVKLPGRFPIDHDQVTLLDALGRAGDLTIYGKRENVLVAREENGVQRFYRIDLTKAENLYNSPAFYLKQNDIIYVEPNTKKARESIDNGSAFIQPSFWISAISLLTSLCVLIFK